MEVNCTEPSPSVRFPWTHTHTSFKLLCDEILLKKVPYFQISSSSSSYNKYLLSTYLCKHILKAQECDYLYFYQRAPQLSITCLRFEA